jgi:hypothetical protein
MDLASDVAICAITQSCGLYKRMYIMSCMVSNDEANVLKREKTLELRGIDLASPPSAYRKVVGQAQVHRPAPRSGK